MEFALVLGLALVIGLTLGAVGGGGSILAVPVLVGVAGLAVTEATTASLIVVGTAATIGLVSDLPSGRVRVAPGIIFGVTGIGGAMLGTFLNRSLEESVLLIGFAILMAVVAAKMAHGLLSSPVPAAAPATVPAAAPGPENERNERGVASLGSPATPGRVERVRNCKVVAGVDTCTIVRLILAGTAVGFLTGLFGVGGGFVIVPALVLLLGFDIRSAAATSLLVIGINSAVALALRADFGSVDWSIVAPFTVFATAGVLVGRRVAHRVPARALTTVLTVLIAVMAVWTATQGISAIG